ncbi:MAG: hypothetical protein ABIQ72_11670 [Usitatibacter sp.]
MKRLLLACGLAWAWSVAAQEAPVPAALGGLDFNSDTEGFRSARARVGGLYRYDNPWSYSGVAAQATRYSQGDYRKDVQAVLGVYRDQRRDNLSGIEAEVGVVTVGGHLRPIGDANWHIVPSPGAGIDLILSADLVETRKALDRAIGYTFAAVAVEKEVVPRLTLSALGGWQSFSDGNDRFHGRARLTWLAVPEHGVTMQLRYRRYSSSEEDVGGAYFNPSHHQQWLGVAAIRKRYAGWTFSGALGAGREQSSSGGSQPSYLAEARAEGPLAGNARIVLRAGYTRAQGYAEGDDNYAYRSIGVGVVVPLR